VWRVLTGVADVTLGLGFLWGSGLLLTFNPLLEIRNGEPALHDGIRRAHRQVISTVRARGGVRVPRGGAARPRGARARRGVGAPAPPSSGKLDVVAGGSLVGGGDSQPVTGFTSLVPSS
jgi:hypothetical protein